MRLRSKICKTGKELSESTVFLKVALIEKLGNTYDVIYGRPPDRLRPYSIGCTNVLQRLLKCVQQVQMGPDFLEKVQEKR